SQGGLARLRILSSRGEKFLRVRLGLGVLAGLHIGLQQTFLRLSVFRVGLKHFGEREDGRLILAMLEFVFGRFVLGVLRRSAREQPENEDQTDRKARRISKRETRF